MMHASFACMYGNERECASLMVLAKHTGHMTHNYNCFIGGGISLDVVAGSSK